MATTSATVAARIQMRFRRGCGARSVLTSGRDPDGSGDDSEPGVTSAGAVDMGGHSRRKNYFSLQTLYGLPVILAEKSLRNKLSSTTLDRGLYSFLHTLPLRP